MKARETKVVLCGGIRTPIGHISKSLSSISPEHLLMLTINALLAKTTLYPHAVDGVMAGWVGQTVGGAGGTEDELLHTAFDGGVGECGVKKFVFSSTCAT